jgi:hypothetical protein
MQCEPNDTKQSPPKPPQKEESGGRQVKIGPRDLETRVRSAVATSPLSRPTVKPLKVVETVG